MADDDSALQPLIQKLGRIAELHAADLEALRRLPATVVRAEPGAYLAREGETPKRCLLLLSGYAFRHKVTKDGARQILALHMRHDFIDLQNMFLDVSDHNLQALGRVEVLAIDKAALQLLALKHPKIARALWHETLVEASIYRESIVNVGRRDARTRIAHLLCEFLMRARVAGLAGDGVYDLPMTQEQLADAMGLTPVHLNRTLRQLTDEGLIDLDRRRLRVRDWGKLAAAADFSALYLHLRQGVPDEA